MTFKVRFHQLDKYLNTFLIETNEWYFADYLSGVGYRVSRLSLYNDRSL